MVWEACQCLCPWLCGLVFPCWLLSACPFARVELLVLLDHDGRGCICLTSPWPRRVSRFCRRLCSGCRGQRRLVRRSSLLFLGPFVVGSWCLLCLFPGPGACPSSHRHLFSSSGYRLFLTSEEFGCHRRKGTIRNWCRTLTFCFRRLCKWACCVLLVGL